MKTILIAVVLLLTSAQANYHNLGGSQYTHSGEQKYNPSTVYVPTNEVYRGYR